MADVVSRAIASNYRLAVNTGDYPPAEWLINPSGLDPLLAGDVPSQYWKYTPDGEDIEEMTQAEKDAVDQAAADAETEGNRTEAKSQTVRKDGLGVSFRSELTERNTRDNYLANRVLELQQVVDAIINSTGAADTIRQAAASVPLSQTQTRSREEALSDYNDRVDTGEDDGGLPASARKKVK